MAKFLKVAIAPSVDSGTTDGVPAGANELIDAGQNFLTTVSVGDYVHNTTDDEWFTVSAVVDNENLTLDAITTGATTVPTGKAYTIYDGDSANYTDQLVSAEGVKLAEQATTQTVTLAYAAGGTATDVITITHSEINSGTSAREDVEAAILSVHSNNNRPEISKDVTFSNDVIVVGIAIA
jgi:hypothetical protein